MILSSAEPKSVAFAVICVVRSMALLQDVIIALCKPIAAARICGYRSSRHQHASSKAVTPKRTHSYRAWPISNVTLGTITPARTAPRMK